MFNTDNDITNINTETAFLQDILVIPMRSSLLVVVSGSRINGFNAFPNKLKKKKKKSF